MYLANRRLLENLASLSMSRLDDLVGRLRSWANSFRIRLLTELQVMALRNRLDRSTLELKQVEKQAQEYKAKSDSDRLAARRENPTARCHRSERIIRTKGDSLSRRRLSKADWVVNSQKSLNASKQSGFVHLHAACRFHALGRNPQRLGRFHSG